MSLNLLTTEHGSLGFSCVEISWKERLQLSLEDAFWGKWVQVHVFHYKSNAGTKWSSTFVVKLDLKKYTYTCSAD